MTKEEMSMAESNVFVPYTLADLKTGTFVKYYKIFNEIERYYYLPIEAGILYGLMVDRLMFNEQSERTLLDKEGKPYILMTVKEMQFYTKVRSEQTIRKIMEQMEKEGLVRIEHQGNQFLNGKVVKKLPNRIYVGKIQILPTDVFLEKTWKKDGTLMNDPFYANGDIQSEYLGQMMLGNVPAVPKANEVKLPEKTSETPVSSNFEDTGKSRSDAVTSKNEGTGEPAKSSRNQESKNLEKNQRADKSRSNAVTSKFEVCKDLKELPDTKNTDTKNIDTKTRNSLNDRFKLVEESFEEKKQYEQEAILRTHFVQTHQSTFFEDQALQHMALFSPSVVAAEDMIEIAYQTKKQVEYRKQKLASQGTNYRICAENFQQELSTCVLRFLSQEKINRAKDKPYVNREKVWHATIETFWEACMYTADRQKEPVPDTEQLPLIPGLENEIRKRKKRDRKEAQTWLYTEIEETPILHLTDWLRNEAIQNG